MSILRNTGDPCPIDEVPLRMAICQDCRFFRGASSSKDGWKITCNWPRSGSFIDQVRIPTVFTEAWDKDVK